MELHILLAGVEFGPYTDHQARDLIGEGFLSETDPAKRLDEADWLPLSEVLAQPRAATAMEETAAVEIPKRNLPSNRHPYSTGPCRKSPRKPPRRKYRPLPKNRQRPRQNPNLPRPCPLPNPRPSSFHL
jgi:hypothetical protein